MIVFSTDLGHLPEFKQQQLQEIAKLACHSKLKMDFLILFGSYARGDWVEDSANRYISDYDLLAITSTKDLKRLELWTDWENQAQAIAGDMPISLLRHSFGYVNEELRMGNYFFNDIAKDGVVLYTNGKRQLVASTNLGSKERLVVANGNLHRWYDSASGFWRGCGYFMVRHEWSHAAFLLHQSVERYYHTLTLVNSGYKHKRHDIEWLANLGASLHPAMKAAMPRSDSPDQERFELLRRAYIDARYSDDYRITEEELIALREHVLDLAVRVRLACGDLLARFCGPEAVADLGELPQTPVYGAESQLPPLPKLIDPETVLWWGRMVMLEGEERGQERGEIKGEAKTLLKLLSFKFGLVPDWAVEKINAADKDQLDCWVERILAIDTLENLLG